MTYLTGDTHGDFRRYSEFNDRTKPGEEDVMIVLGDAGLNYFGDERDAMRKAFVNYFPFTTFCLHGNHEMRPWDVPGMQMKQYRGGDVWYEPAFPRIVYAKDGEVYDFDGYQCIVIGGAYSVDKYTRLARGWRWFENEQPSEAIKREVENKLDSLGRRVDVILSHTCPLKYEPIETFLGGIDQRSVDTSTEAWLDTIEESVDYRKWYCGHFHTSKKTHRLQFMFMDIDVMSIGTGENSCISNLQSNKEEHS